MKEEKVGLYEHVGCVQRTNLKFVMYVSKPYGSSADGSAKVHVKSAAYGIRESR